MLLGHLKHSSGFLLLRPCPTGGMGEETQRPRQDRVISILLLLLAPPYPCTPPTASSRAKLISTDGLAAVLKV